MDMHPDTKDTSVLDRTMGCYTSHVTFNESQFPFAAELTPEPNDYVFDHSLDPSPIDPPLFFYPSQHTPPAVAAKSPRQVAASPRQQTAAEPSSPTSPFARPATTSPRN
jgi:hypothetical protein